MKINFYTVLFSVVINIAFIPDFGLMGAAYATVISEVFLLFLQVKTLHLEHSILFPMQYLQKIFLASSLMGIMLFFSENFILEEFGRLSGLGILMIFSGILFFGTLFFTRFFNPELKGFLGRK